MRARFQIPIPPVCSISQAETALDDFLAGKVDLTTQDLFFPPFDLDVPFKFTVEGDEWTLNKMTAGMVLFGVDIRVPTLDDVLPFDDERLRKLLP